MKKHYSLIACFVFFLAQSNAQTYTNKQLSGNWLVEKVDYKYASNHNEDYPLSRKDFDNMVKFKKVFEIDEKSIKEHYGDIGEHFVYKIEGNKLYYWNPAKNDDKAILDDMIKKSPSTTVYDLSFEKDKMIWFKGNDTYILRFHLAKQ
jgi:hypothetical protein